MEAIGFGFTIIAEARTLVTSIKTRIANVHHGPDTFRSLSNDLDRLMLHIGEVEAQLQSAPSAIPAGVSGVFNETLSSVCNVLNRCDSTLAANCAKAFSGSSNGVTARAKSLFRRTTQAKALSETMNDLKPQVQNASTQLLSLVSMLVTGLKSQELQNVIVPELRSLRNASGVKEAYVVGASTPALPQGAHLDFTSKDANGKYITPEGMLKEIVLSSESSATVAAAAGVITPAHGVVGMAGVGKSIALQGLAFDKDILVRFPGGIHYMELGQAAASPTAIREMTKIMRLSGASTSVSIVERSESLREAVDYAIAWFNGKVCLFLVDDLWPTQDCPTGFLNDLRQLLRCCRESRMAITTRSTFIAHSAGCRIEFGSRDPLGAVSVNIFMMHVTRYATRAVPQESNGNLRPSVVTILSICAGLPLALAVAGCAVAFLSEEFGDIESACDAYSSQLVGQMIEVGEEHGQEGSSVNAGIVLSLKILEAEFVKLQARSAVAPEHTIADFYTSLCILRHQAWVPVSLLSRMWKVRKEFALAIVRLFSGLSLCKLTYRQQTESAPKEGGLTLHDLQLDFCKRQAKVKTTYSVWHARLLNGYLDRELNTTGASLSGECGVIHDYLLLAHTSRAWWSVPNDGYIRENVARHLSSAGLGIELAALLLDARWTHARAEIGGMLAFKSDFECLSSMGDQVLSHSVSQSFENIWKAIQLSWGRVQEGQRSFQFQLFGRLFNLRKDDAVINAYLKSIQNQTPLPYLIPVNSFFSDPRAGQIMEVPVGSACDAVDCSPCGRFIVAGAGNDIVVADVSTGEMLKRLEGHTRYITCLRFAGGSKKIVSGSSDNSVAIWEWEKSGSPIAVLNAHDSLVMGVAVSSNGERILSCSCDLSVKVWNATTGAQLAKLVRASVVTCVAISSDDRYVAIGLANGSLEIVDSYTGDPFFEDTNAHNLAILSVAFSVKNQRLVTGSADSSIRLWDTTTWTSVGEPLQGHTSHVRSVALSPDGQFIASGSDDGTLRLWGANTGRINWASSNVHSSVRSVAFSSDAGRIISGSLDGIVRVWDTCVEAETTEQEHGCFAEAKSISISHDGLQFATGSNDGTVCLWDSRTSTQIGPSLNGHTDVVRCVSFSHDGRRMVSCSDDRTARLWDLETFVQLGNPFEGHTDFLFYGSFSADGLRIVSGACDETIRIWDTELGVQIGDPLTRPMGSAKVVSESCDGCYVVAKHFDSIVIWNREKQTVVWQPGERPDNSQMTDEEAETIILSCGQEAPHLWPESFPEYYGELYCRKNSVYSNVPANDTLLGTFPSDILQWRYTEVRKVLVALLQNGTIAICDLTGTNA